MTRFTDNHELVKRVFSIIKKCFNESEVQLFNDVASNGVNIIYKVSYSCYL